MLKQTTTPFIVIDQAQPRIAQIIAGVSGALFVLTALALLFAPRWFFDNIGYFAPFNRHYEGDLGSFLLPLGVGLLFAARAPKRHRGIIAIAAAGSALHVLNHIFDGVTQSFTLVHWLSDSVPLLVTSLLLVVAWREAH